MVNHKSEFRQTKEWKLFRIEKLQEVGHRCEMCNTQHLPRDLQVHHLDPDNYEDLDAEMFRVLCSTCHVKIVEWFARKVLGKKFKPMPNFRDWFRLLGDFLPIRAVEKARMIIAQQQESKED